MVVIHRRQTREQYRAADEGSRAFFIAENLLGTEGVSLDGKLLVGFQPIPAEISRFGDSGHLVRRCHERPGARPKLPVEELGE